MSKPDPGLPKIATETGGGYFELTSANNMSATFVRIADELHRQYALAFTPAKFDGKTHRIEVRIRRPNLTARARKSYVAKARVEEFQNPQGPAKAGCHLPFETGSSQIIAKVPPAADIKRYETSRRT